VLIAARFIVDVQTVISRKKDPIRIRCRQHWCDPIAAPPSTSFPTRSWCAHHSQLQAGGTNQDGGGDRADPRKAVAAMSDAPPPDISITEGAKAVMNDPRW